MKVTYALKKIKGETGTEWVDVEVSDDHESLYEKRDKLNNNNDGFQYIVVPRYKE